jgi:branched-chain amino acid transport system ATP-binding protein
VRDGMAFVTEERSLFMKMSTADNLRVAGVEVEPVVELFPELVSRLKVTAGRMSGGEQQMLTLARAIAKRPTTLLADELSLGLAPLVVARLLDTVRRAADEGLGVLLVEQHLTRALEVADYAIVMQRGVVRLEGAAADLRGRADEISSHYLTSVHDDAPA